MKRYLSAAGVLVGSAALIASTLLVTAPAAQAVADGTLIVNVVDQYGRPVVGAIQLYDSATGDSIDENGGGGGTPTAASTHVFTAPEGGYSMMSIAPWSGIDCAGTSPCLALTGGPTTFTPVVTVAGGSVTSYAMHVTVPSITGSPAVGSALTLQIPPGLTAMQSVFGVIPGLAGAPTTQQWVRGATDLPGAIGPTYTTVPADGKQAMTARLTPSFGVSLIFSTLGVQVPPFTTNAITMAKYKPVKTKTKVTVPGSFRSGDRVSMTVKVSAKSGKPDGFVTIKIGNFKTKKKLKKGSVFITLPHLSPGTYTIATSYGGSDLFAKSKAKRATITVRK